MSESWRADLAMIRQRAAARCGLREYPAELIKVAELIDRAGNKTTPWQFRQLQGRAAELKWIR